MRPVPSLCAARAPTPHHGSPVRFETILHLTDARALGTRAELRHSFEDQVAFGPVSAAGACPDAAKWTGRQIDSVARALRAAPGAPTPVLIPAPLAALGAPNTALACDAAARSNALCPQDICLVFSDAAFAGDPADSSGRIAKLRRLGFRVGIDMRKSWQTPLSESLRLMIDCLHVDARRIEGQPDLVAVTSLAVAAGIRVFADGARWRDADMLGACGVIAAIAPRADA